MLKRVLPVLLSLGLGACIPYPMQTVEPLEVTVVDATTGTPLQDIHYLRIVCDVHDFTCAHAFIDSGISPGAHLVLAGKRRWGMWSPVPGGMPVPNHQIAIWKTGYQAIIFSQYGNNIDEFSNGTPRADIKHLITQIPQDRNYLRDENPDLTLHGGLIRLRPSAPTAR